MTARRVCWNVVAAFVVLYAIALMLFLVGAFGLFGSPRGPLAGIFVVILGLPWTTMLDWLPGHLRPWAAGLAPGLNVVVLATLCRVRFL